MTTLDTQKANGESGNVLFLILIAVALFAALSYAVTQSSRSGGSNASGETNLLNSAQITQYPAGIRTSILRMIIGGVDVSSLEFNAPADFDLVNNPNFTAGNGVFHPQGGGATYTEPPDELIEGTAAGDGLWHFNSNFEIPNIGINGAGGSELIAFLPGLNDSVCRKINQQLGIGGTPGTPPDFGADVEADYKTTIMDDNSTIAGITDTTFADTATQVFPAALAGQPFGCFANDTAGENVYFHVLVER